MANYFKAEDIVRDREAHTGDPFCECKDCRLRFATREEAVAHIRDHGGYAHYPGGTAIARDPMRAKDA